MTTNPEIDQDRVFDLFDTYKKHGVVMFHDQRRIYNFIANRLDGSMSILEAGCGNGVGSAIIDRMCLSFHATDKLESNVKFARELYPWIDFSVWDINEPWAGNSKSIVICIEAFEHVANPQDAMRNLINAAVHEVWLSTPNGMGKPRPPENIHHCLEYRPDEILGFIRNVSALCHVSIFECNEFSEVQIDNIMQSMTPLLYRISHESSA